MRGFVALAALTMLAGCGGGGSSGGAAPATPATPATPAPAPTPAPATTFTPVAAAKPTAGLALPLGKCVNMGNMLEAPNEGDWGRAIVDEDFTIIKNGGFSTVRVPVRFSGHANTTAPYTINAAFMARVRHVVDTALAAKLNVIIDLHNYDEINSDPAANVQRFTALWQQIADAFKDEPDATVWFELANEPHDKLTNANVSTLFTPALAAIRATNPKRPVIIGGQDYSSLTSLATLPMPNDPYVVPTFHYYDPFDFTHQGATFITNPPPVGRVFGGQADLDALAKNLTTVQNYMAATGRVPFIGEYGAIDDTGISNEQRVLYYHTVTSAWASIGLQSCAWGYSNTFKLRAGNAWVPGMLEGLATTTTVQ